jgi:hypothetical protein
MKTVILPMIFSVLLLMAEAKEDEPSGEVGRKFIFGEKFSSFLFENFMVKPGF